MALLKYLLPVFFIVYSLGEIAKIQIIPAVSSGIFDLVLLVLLAVWLSTVKKTKKYALKTPILVFSFIALFSLLINVMRFTSNEILVSSLYLVRFILYAGIYFVFVDIGKTYKNLIPKYMFLTGLIFLILGFLQYFIFPSLKPYYHLGWDEHIFRLFSTFLDPNFAGVFLVLILVFVFILKDKIFSKKWVWTYHVFLALNFLAIILTYSRGALLMLLTCVVAYSAITKNWKLTAGIILSFIIIFIILSPKFDQENTNLLRFASVETRIESSRTALTIWQKNPAGVGFNTYRYAREQYGDLDTSKFGPSHAGAGVDNSFIFVLVTTGFVGLGAYIYMLYRMFRLGFSNIRQNKFALVLVVSLIGLVVNALTINSLFYSFIMVWIFILTGFTESTSRE